MYWYEPVIKQVHKCHRGEPSPRIQPCVCPPPTEININGAFWVESTDSRGRGSDTHGRVLDRNDVRRSRRVSRTEKTDTASARSMNAVDGMSEG